MANVFRKQLLHGGIGSLLIRAIGIGFSLSLSILLARQLSADGYGAYSFVLSILVLLSIPVQAGLPTLAVREAAKAQHNQNWLLVAGLWTWSIRWSLVYFSAISIVFVLLGWKYPGYLQSKTSTIVVAGFISVFAISLVTVQGAILRGMGRVLLGQIPDIIFRPAIFLCLLGMTIYLAPPSFFTPQCAMQLYAVSAIASLLFVFVLMLHVMPVSLSDYRLFERDSYKWWASIYPLTIVGGFQLMYGYLDIILIGLFRSDGEVGIYRVVTQISSLVIFGLAAVNQVLHPLFSKLYFSKDMVKLQELVTFSSRIIFGFAIVPAIALILFGEELLGVVFGEEFKTGSVALIILAFGQTANAAFGSVGALLNMTGYEKETRNGMLAALGVNIFLSTLLIPYFGIEGAAISTATSMVVWNYLLRRSVKNRLNIESASWAWKK